MTVIRPNADAVLEQRAAQSAAGQTVDNQRSIYVVLEGYEQESCFILFFWAFAMMGYKTRSTLHERFHQRSLVNVGAGVNILPEDVQLYPPPASLSERDQKCLVTPSIDCRAQSVCVNRKCSDVAEAVKTVCETEYERLEPSCHPLHRLGDTIHRLYWHRGGIGDALGQSSSSKATLPASPPALA